MTAGEQDDGGEMKSGGAVSRPGRMERGEASAIAGQA